MPQNQDKSPAHEAGRPASEPSALPMASPDETDIGWGERPEPDEDDRLLADRPPHWDAR